MFDPPLITNLFDFCCTPKYNCPICLENFNNDQGSVHTKCKHKFCIDCYTKHSSRGGDVSCPICRQKIIACDVGEKKDMSNRDEQIECFSNLIDRTVIGQNTSKMNFGWIIEGEEEEITYHAWIFRNQTKEGSRCDTPVSDVTENERQTIFENSFKELQLNITDTWDKLNKYRPTQ